MKFFTILLILSTFIFSKNLPLVHWNTVSFPPAFIIKGTYENKGYFDAMRNTIINNSTDLKHIVEVGNVKLAMVNLQRLDNACTSGLLKNEKREKFIYFSKPALYTLPNEFTIRKSDEEKFKPYLTSKQEIDLEKLLKDDKFRFGYVDKRAYHKHIDKLLEEYKLNKTSMARTAQDLTRGLLMMLSLNRVDYIIEYPTMVEYIKKSENIKEDFMQYPIKDANNLIASYISCSKTPNGKKLIHKINSIIDTNGHEIIDGYKKWLSSETLQRYESNLKNIQ